MPNNQITINAIPDDHYTRLKDEAQAAGISLNNLVRRRLGIPEAKPGNPPGSSRKGAQQPRGKQRGIKRTREEIQLAREQDEHTNEAA